MTRPDQARRSCLTVPGSSSRFLEKARGLPADEVCLDLEDAVAPAAKEAARAQVAEAVSGDWGGKLVAVRINSAATRWAYRDVIEIVARAGRQPDAIILPKVSGPAHIVWLDLLLGQLEQDLGLSPGTIRIEAQIEDAAGLAVADEIAASSGRLEALIFGPADFMASVGMRSLQIGAPPGGYAGADAFHYPRLRILVAARARGLLAVDGPYAAIGDIDGLSRSAASAAALGFDGKWVLHPSQIDPVNTAFSPDQEQYERAELILEAYQYYMTVEQRGAFMLGDEMIDEASRRLAQGAAARGRAAGLTREQQFRPSAG